MKTFGHQRPVRDKSGQIETLIDSPARAVTRNTLGGRFGSDSDRRLVVSLEAGDLIVVRPSKTRRVYRIEAKDLFLYLLRCEANRIVLERARDKKSKRADRLARQRQERAERRLFKS